MVTADVQTTLEQYFTEVAKPVLQTAVSRSTGAEEIPSRDGFLRRLQVKFVCRISGPNVVRSSLSKSATPVPSDSKFLSRNVR
jgi:hypothetical protein